MKPLKTTCLFLSIGICFCLVGLMTLLISLSNITFVHVTYHALVYVGGAILFISFIGPTSLYLARPKMPYALRKANHSLGLLLPIVGLFLLASGVNFEPSLSRIFLGLASALLIVIGLCVFIYLALLLPKSFTVRAFLSLIKTNHLFGDRKENISDTLYNRWKTNKPTLTHNNIAPDGFMYDLTLNKHSLLDYLDSYPSAYWVIQFVSYSSPHVRQHIHEVEELFKSYPNKGIRFLIIYTREAHPEDEWRLHDQYFSDETEDEKSHSFYQHSTLDDRLSMANKLIKDHQLLMPVFLDNLDNTLLSNYNSWPIRIYIIQNKRIVMSSQEGPFGYEPASLKKMLDSLINKNTHSPFSISTSIS